MHTHTTAPARLHLLLPWLNDELTEAGWWLPREYSGQPTRIPEGYAQVRRAIAQFVASFDGSAGAAHIEVVAAPLERGHVVEVEPPDAVRYESPEDPTDEDLFTMGGVLQLLLGQGFGDATTQGLAFPVASLQVAVRSAGRTLTKRKSPSGTRVIAGGTKAQRDYRAAGAYVLQVSGPTTELVPFLVLQLLTAPNMVEVRRCMRPSCDHFVISAVGVRGAPRKFCSKVCIALNQDLRDRGRPKKKGHR